MAPKGGNFDVQVGAANGDEKVLSYTGTSVAGNVSLNLTLQGGFIADGFPYTDITPYREFTAPALWDGIYFNWEWQLCQNNMGHWNHVTYDPTMEILFSSSASSPAGPGNNTTNIIIAVCSSLAVLALVGGIILLFLFNENFKNFIRPFRSRKIHSRESNPTSNSKSSWVRGRTESSGLH